MGRATNRRDILPKSHAKQEFCLSDADLAALTATEKRNPFSAKAAPMKLYKRAEVREVAIRKYGSEQRLAEELEARASKRRSRAAAQGTMNSFLRGEAAATSGASHNGVELHALIKERVEVVRAGDATPQDALPRCVLYWMKTALRGHHNPALDAARAEAAARDLPLVVAAPVLLDYTYASARRVQFVLEGLRDAQRELRFQAGPDLLVHFGGADAEEDWEALMALVRLAAVVVTEAMPVPPETDWLTRLCSEAPAGIGIWAVDCACTYPSRLVTRAYDRASAFRSTTSAGRKERLAPDGLYAALPDLSCFAAIADTADAAPPPPPSWLPWQSLDLSQADILALMSRCIRLDDSVPPVAHLRGGSRAGYSRWDEFRQSGGLRHYAMTRNNAMNRGGVSRLSAYHRWGMVSPFKIARDAGSCSSGGARKFLDEFLVWRELSYAFCAHKAPAALHTLQALPKWAQSTLANHASDEKQVLDESEIEAGRTGDAFWDAAQQQLVATGELHNNVRMTWGKAFLRWAPTPERALALALHCNHKYALDGCDPASYGGVLWCFGQFDGPKGAQGTPMYGSLRARPTAAHARRLDPQRYAQLPA